jgi:hypothetical protein
MKWFKHDSDASRDPKIRKLRRRHGLEGVGLYWTIIELIVGDLEAGSFTFELEHDAELIAEDVGIPRERVEEMMKSMIELGLFECSHGVITCFKLLKRLDTSQVNKGWRQEITALKKRLDGQKVIKGHDSDMTPSGQKRREQNRIHNQGVIDTELSSTVVSGGQVDPETGEVIL